MLFVALVHHPVKNRLNQEIASTVDVFDYFDLGRLSLTYPMAAMLWVNPLASQREGFERMRAHANHPDRDVEARGSFERLHWVDDLAQAKAFVAQRSGQDPWVVATTAMQTPNAVDVAALRQALTQSRAILLLFGKAWGLTADVIAQADAVLAPIDEGTGFNHLSVRTAVAIIVDRLLRR